MLIMTRADGLLLKDSTAGNINAPEAVTYSAIIYCLRCLISEDIPLNQGCLKPIHVRIPEGSFLSPSERAAVVGGNVLTVRSSLRLSMLILELTLPLESKSDRCHSKGI